MFISDSRSLYVTIPGPGVTADATQLEKYTLILVKTYFVYLIKRVKGPDIKMLQSFPEINQFIDLIPWCRKSYDRHPWFAYCNEEWHG